MDEDGDLDEIIDYLDSYGFHFGIEEPIMGINNQHIFKKMRNRKFAEDEVVVEEETTVTEETVEESPDSHDQFVSILVDMGLSAEQAEAVHTMAMDLIDAGEGEETTTEEVSEEVKVEASRQRRNRRSRRAEFARERRSQQRPSAS